ncbi:putative peptidase family-domain-containing protein [Staphylotrichum tortipilum]|uniref:Peptidase family-domain-containing protein n=1 Tax=Staphylotrichum tortipilum TaxID=2831512 RepID=A0AAN6RW38_9PEZI|nr:putative peptidase family-domain-containing protein [Staphylotrichum longicolle]
MIELDNFPANGTEVSDVYQRCVLVSGKCNTNAAIKNDDGHVVVTVKDSAGASLFPEQQWPMCQGYFKALVLLSPGLNKVTIAATDRDIFMRYTPLLQTPPLHLAILIAKDSPLQIDCPPAKFGGISSTHSSLDAAIAKFRMTAYMWQALTAEDLRAKGLGRRSFRLEEEWTTDTLSQQSLHALTTGAVPKVHLIRTSKTLAYLRAADLAQQNPHASRKDELHAIFTAALLAHGGPFASHTRPVVAGLILDSHYNPDVNKHILAHAALGCHQPAGLSLGMFGSHLTFSWPRFLEEVPSSLLDPTPAGDTVANDNGECTTLWQACAVGQGAFLHEVGHAAGGIGAVVLIKNGVRTMVLKGEPGAAVETFRYSRGELEKMGNKDKQIGLEVTGMNGKQCTIWNVWGLFRGRSYVRVPGTDIRLAKQSISSSEVGSRWDDTWQWAVMLKRRDKDGNLVDASKIDIRVGCQLDGAEVYYKNGTKIPCGPRGPNERDPGMGGHQARKIALPRGVEVTKVAVTRIPPANHKIIGFYGTSGKWGMCCEFGIVTAPRDAVLPDSMYDLDELQNKPEEEGRSSKRRRIDDEDMASGDEKDDEDTQGTDESEASEDEDCGYDDGSDSEVERVYAR